MRRAWSTWGAVCGAVALALTTTVVTGVQGAFGDSHDTSTSTTTTSTTTTSTTTTTGPATDESAGATGEVGTTAGEVQATAEIVGGPVLIMGIDAEDGGSGGHGPSPRGSASSTTSSGT